LVAYHYGQGAAWAYIAAESAKQIHDQFPDFSIVETPPMWLADGERRELEARMSFDIDNPTGWLAEVLERRRKRQV
jgi:hypothetical protein